MIRCAIVLNLLRRAACSCIFVGSNEMSLYMCGCTCKVKERHYPYPAGHALYHSSHRPLHATEKTRGLIQCNCVGAGEYQILFHVTCRRSQSNPDLVE